MNLLFKTEKHTGEKKTICLILHRFYFNAYKCLVLIMPEKIKPSLAVLLCFVIGDRTSLTGDKLSHHFAAKIHGFQRHILPKHKTKSQSDNLSRQGGLKSGQVSNIPPLLIQEHACVQDIFWMGGGVGRLLREEWERSTSQKLTALHATFALYGHNSQLLHLTRKKLSYITYFRHITHRYQPRGYPDDIWQTHVLRTVVLMCYCKPWRLTVVTVAGY